MDPGWGAAQHMVETREWKGGGEREGKSLGSGISKGQSRGRIQKPNGRLVLAPGSAFVRLWPPCAEGAGGSARPGASASAAVSPHPPRAGLGGGRGAREQARRAVWAEPALGGERPGGGGQGGGAGAAARSAGLAPSCCAGTCRAAEVSAAREAAGLAGWEWVGEGDFGSFPSPSGGEKEARSVDPDLSTAFGVLGPSSTTQAGH